MSQRIFRIEGNVINLQGTGVPNLRVDAWDKDLLLDDFLGSAITDVDGKFLIEFPEKRFREFFLDRTPDVFFVVYSGTTKLKDTRKTFVCSLGEETATVTLKVDVPVNETPPEVKDEFVVKGLVTGFEGSAPGNVLVKVSDVRRKQQKQLAEVYTDAANRYEAHYQADQLLEPDKGYANLKVELFDPLAKSLRLGESDVVFKAPRVLQLNVAITRTYSEYDRYTTIVREATKGDALSSLKEDDVPFISDETGIEAQFIEYLVSSTNLAKKTGQPAAFFYGLARQGLPTNLADILEQDVNILRQAIHDALAANIVPDSLAAKLENIFARLAELSSIDPGVQSKRDRRKVQHLAKLSGLGEEKAKVLAHKAVNPTLLDDRTLSQLVESGELEEGEARDVGLTGGLYELLDRDMDLVAAFKTFNFAQLGGAQLRRLEDLVEIEPDDMPAALEGTGAVLPAGISNSDYAKLISKRVEILFPSKALWARMRRVEPKDVPGDIKALQPLLVANIGTLKAQRLEDLDGVDPERIETLRPVHTRLRAFVNGYPGLRLGEILEDSTISVPEKAERVRERVGLLSRFRDQNAEIEYLALDYAPRGTALKLLDFSGFSEDERRMLLKTLKAYQRIQTITQDAVNTRLLLAEGHVFAVSIALASNRMLGSTLGLPLYVISDLRQRALSVATGTMVSIQGMVDLIQGGFAWLNVNNQGPSILEYLKEIDGWETLFGNLDYCKCEHCRSIFSPAAYFVDLMRFVEQHILVAFEEHPDHALHLRIRRPDLWKLPLSCENTNALIPYLVIVNEVLENHLYLRLGNEPDTLPSPGADRSELEAEVYNLLANSVGSFRQPFLLPLVRLQSYLKHFDITRGEAAQLVAGTPDALSYEPLDDEVGAAVLGLSMHGGSDDEPPYPHRDFELIVTPIREIGDRLDKIYGLPFREERGEIRFRDPALLPTSDAYEESRNDVQLLLRAMGLSRTELDAVINTRFVRFGAHPGEHESGLNIRIIGEKRDPIKSIQPDIERIQGLTVEALDRMHRFVRLWRATPWTIGELDLLIVELDHQGHCSGLEAETIQRLAELLQIQSHFEISVEDLVSLWSWLPCIAVDGAETPFFNRLFEGSDFICNDWHEDASSLEPFLHPALRITPPGEPDEVLPGLLAGLKVDDATLYALTVHLAEPLTIEDLEAPEESKRTFALHRGNLSLIYRHARLTEWLGLSVSELFQLTELAGLSADTQVSDLGSLGTLLAFQTWWKSTNWSLDDLAFMTGGTLIHSANYPDAEATCERLMQKVRESKPLLFGTSLFSYLEGVTEAQSRDIILANTHAFAAVPGLRYRLSEAFDSETISTAIHIPVIPDDPILATQDELFTLLVAYLTPGDSGKPSIPVFDDTLFAKLPNVTESQSRAIVAENGSLIVPVPLEDVYWLAEDFDPGTSINIPTGIPVTDEDSKELLARYHVSEVISSLLSAELGLTMQKIKAMIALTGTNLADAQFVRALQTNGPKDSLIALVAALLRLRVLFKDTCFETDALGFVDEQAALFEATDFVNLSTQTVRLVALYAEMAQAGENGADRRSALHNRLRHYAGERFYPESGDNFAQAELAIVLGIEVGLAITAHEELDLPENALEAMVKLMRCVELAGLLGVGGEILPRIVANDYPSLDRAATALRSAIRTKYPDDAQWRDKIEPFDDRGRTIRRDALTDYLLHSISPRLFSSHNDLYHYFLIDVELDGCARTSRIVAANSSVQLYVHRALMNLEQDRAEVIEIELDDEAVDEWEWRKNYRVWEANRKVFLYPENYIEPDLRDNKTPLFEELETTLLQQEINEDSVLEAYSSYMRGFDEVARLSIAGSYHDLYAGREHDVLHLFGVTQGDSFSYYYRAVENLYYFELDETREDRGIVWNPWRKIDVQIPVRKVSPIVFNKRLYLFWVEIITQPVNSDFEGGGSFFTGYKHTMSLHFTKLMLDGSWSAPVKIKLDSGPFDNGDGVIEDLLEISKRYLSPEDSEGNSFYRVLPSYGTENDWHLTKKLVGEVNNDWSVELTKKVREREKMLA